MSIGTTLQKIRQARDLTQQEVATQMYVTRQTISRWEQGKTMPNIYALKDLAQLYNVSLDQLVAMHPSNSKEEAGHKMKKINWLALFGFFLVQRYCHHGSCLGSCRNLMWSLDLHHRLYSVSILISR